MRPELHHGAELISLGLTELLLAHAAPHTIVQHLQQTSVTGSCSSVDGGESDLGESVSGGAVVTILVTGVSAVIGTITQRGQWDTLS